MLTFFARLWAYFGPIGILSVLLWLAAVGVAVAGFWKLSDRRTKLVWIAVGLAVLAFYTGKINSHFVSRIGIDRSEQEAAMRERQRQERLRREKEAREQMMFAEESVTDVQQIKDDEEADDDDEGEDAAGTPTDRDADNERAPDDGEGQEDEAEQDDEAEQVPLYKQRGKQEREGGKTQADKQLRKATEERAKQEQISGKKLPEEDKLRADIWDKVNLFVTRWVLVVLLLLGVYDYLRRFNRTFDAFLPMPLAGSWLDRISPKSMTVLVTRTDESALAPHLRNLVRRGETFLYFGPKDPLDEGVMTRFGPTQLSLNPRFYTMGAWLYDVHKANVHGHADFTPGEHHDVPFLRHFSFAWLRKLGERWPNSAEHIDLFIYNLGRFGKHVLRRLPVVVALIVVLFIPLLIFFSRSSYYLPHYILTMVLAPWPVLLSNVPAFHPFLPKIRDLADRTPADRDFFFDAAWFGRASAVITNAEKAPDILDDLRRFLKTRRVPSAHCARTVNVVWNFGPFPKSVDRDEFLKLARAANFRFIHVADRVPADANDLYEETFDGLENC